MAAAIVEVSLAIVRSGQKPSRDIIVALCAGEETGGFAGARWLTTGHKDLIDAEKPILEELNKITGAPPKDYARYKFTIEQAVETLQDSAELAGQDLKTRGAALAQHDKRDKAERDEIGSTTDAKEAADKVAKKDAANAPGAPPVKKAPTLRRKGEVVPDKQQ